MQQTKWINNKAPHLNNNWKFGGRKSAPARERKSQTINLYIISMLWIWQKWATQYTDEQVSWLLFFFTTMSHVLYCTISIYVCPFPSCTHLPCGKWAAVIAPVHLAARRRKGLPSLYTDGSRVIVFRWCLHADNAGGWTSKSWSLFFNSAKRCFWLCLSIFYVGQSPRWFELHPLLWSFNCGGKNKVCRMGLFYNLQGHGLTALRRY